MQPSSYGVLDGIVGKFSGDSTYSESQSLSPEVASRFISPSGLAGIMVVVA